MTTEVNQSPAPTETDNRLGSSALLGSVSDFERYKGMFGCYAFYEAGVCLYVGKATCIYSRVKGHKLRFRNAERFSAWNLGRHIKGMDYADAHAFLSLMEAYFIAVLDPLENIKRPEFMRMMWGEIGAARTVAIRKVYDIMGDSLCILPNSVSAAPSGISKPTNNTP